MRENIVSHPQNYLKNALRPFGLLVIFSMMINLLVLATPLYMLQIYNRVLASKSIETLLSLTILTVVIILFAAFFEYVRDKIVARAALRFENNIRQKLFDNLIYIYMTLVKEGQKNNLH